MIIREMEKYLDEVKKKRMLPAPQAVLDGEVVVLDETGKPSFNRLQNYKPGENIAFYVLDVLWLDGYDLTKLSLAERKEIMKGLIVDNQIFKYNDDFPDGPALFGQIKKMGLEGVVAKKKDSIYIPGKRTNNWLKIPVLVYEDYVIGGWAESGSGRLYRTLIIGHYQAGKLYYKHHSGWGMSEKENKQLFARLKANEIDASPFVNAQDIESETPLHWTKPEIVGVFEQTNKRSPSGKIRHPVILKALREDKAPVDVEDQPEASMTKPEKTRYSGKPSSSSEGWEKVDNREITSREVMNIGGRKLEIVKVEKPVWKGISQAEVLKYYINIFDFIKPYLRDRPLGIYAIPGSVYDEENEDKGQFLRGMEGRQPEWATIFSTERKQKEKGKNNTIDWLVCNDLATLVYIINLSSIDLHPWNSRTVKPNEPDYLVIDLDPSDGDFNKAILTAQAAKEFFNKHKLKAFIKTSDKTGLHIYIPCTGVEYGKSRILAEKICTGIHQMVPEITTMNTSRNSRGNKLYVDPSQNDYADRVAAAYCLRAYNKPNVSTPLEWNEVQSKLHPAEFNIHTIFKRLEEKGDLFKGLFDKRIAAANSKILGGSGL